MALPTHPQFDCTNDADRGERWAEYLEGLTMMFHGMDLFELVGTPAKALTDEENSLNKKTRMRKRALLLHYGGPEVRRVVNSFPPDKMGAADDYKLLVAALNTYFKPEQNLELLRFKFRECVQLVGESMDDYHQRLRHLAKNFKFGDMDGEIKSQIIQKCTSSRLRRRALRE